jgi:hypothetical protein
MNMRDAGPAVEAACSGAAERMAAIEWGAPAPTSPTLAPSQRLSRTRCAHGFFTIGGLSAAVHSTRRLGKTQGVTVTVGGDALQLTGALTPTQARSMAKALTLAAEAVDRLQGGAR